MARELANFQCFGERAKKCNARVFLAAGVPEWTTSGSALHPGFPATACHPTTLCMSCGLKCLEQQGYHYQTAAVCCDTDTQNA